MSSRPLHISNLDIVAFRGIERVLSLNFGRRLTIIYGGNATGKSSVAQAIEFAISGQVRDNQDGLIPAEYLDNTRGVRPGRVSLTLDDGTRLAGATDHLRSDIERHFRNVCGVDWPDRQPVPITATHITTQGMLARLLGNSNPITRTDLSSLCSGAHLRLLVSRAQKLSDHFRQAYSGRNIQSELREARSVYDSAKLLHDSMLVKSHAPEVSSTAIEARVRDLNARSSLPESTSVETLLAHLDAEIDKLDQRVRVTEALFARTRELGQQEAELGELRRQAAELALTESDLQTRRGAAAESLARTRERLGGLATQRALLLEVMATHERQQQLASDIAALEDRLREVNSTELRVKEELRQLRHDLDGTCENLAARSTKLARLQQSRQTAELRQSTLARAMSEIEALSPESDPEIEGQLANLRQQLADLGSSAERAARDLDDASKAETSAGARLADASQLGERFLNAVSEMRAFLKDSHCPLCGHDHGSEDALVQSIERMCATALQGADALRRDFEAASRGRQESADKKSRIADAMARVDQDIFQLTAVVNDRVEKRGKATARIESILRSAGITLPCQADALRPGQVEARVRLAGIEQEIRDASAGQPEDEARRSDLERALAAKASEGQQLERLANELRDQTTKMRSAHLEGLPAADIEKNKAELANIETLVRTLQREEGQAQATVLDLERTIGQRKMESSGIERRRQVVTALLDSLDAELQNVGATRDVRTLVEAEQRARQQRENLALLKSEALRAAQAQQQIEENRAVLRSRQQLDGAQKSLTELQSRQKRLEERSSQFRTLYDMRP